MLRRPVFYSHHPLRRDRESPNSPSIELKSPATNAAVREARSPKIPKNADSAPVEPAPLVPLVWPLDPLD